VGDVVQALIKLGVHEPAVGTIYNIGSDQEITINELAAVVKDVTGSSSPIRHISYEEAYGKNFEDMVRRVPDLGRIRAAIGYSPSKNIREIVQAVTDSLVRQTPAETNNVSVAASFAQAD
jgi:UDP-glucose 4-epimerase